MPTRIIKNSIKSPKNRLNSTKLLSTPLAILAWFGVIAVLFWGFSHISRSIFILVAAAVVAYTVSPFVKRLEKLMPKHFAILIIYLVLLTLLSGFTFFLVKTAIAQLLSLVHSNQGLLTSNQVESTFKQFNIAPEQLKEAEVQITKQAEKLSASIVPLISSFFSFILDLILVTILSIYMLIDSARILNWIERNTPIHHKKRLTFFLATLNIVIGGYIRGQFTLSLIIGLLIGIGMTVLRVPYAILLGMLAFVLSFIPILGVLISGGVCILLALTKGWILAIAVLAYFVIAHIIEGDILGPRIVGKALGLHPIVSILSLLIGTELFGITGALLASPIAGVLQAILVSSWIEWRRDHSKEFKRLR